MDNVATGNFYVVCKHLMSRFCSESIFSHTRLELVIWCWWTKRTTCTARRVHYPLPRTYIVSVRSARVQSPVKYTNHSSTGRPPPITASLWTERPPPITASLWTERPPPITFRRTDGLGRFRRGCFYIGADCTLLSAPGRQLQLCSGGRHCPSVCLSAELRF